MRLSGSSRSKISFFSAVWLSRGRWIHRALLRLIKCSSGYFPLVSPGESKITAWVRCFNIHAPASKQLQTSACVKWQAVKEDWQRTKSGAWYSEQHSLAQETHDKLPSEKRGIFFFKKNSSRVNSIWRCLQSELPRQTAYRCVSVRICGAAVSSATQQFTCYGAANLLYVQVRGIKLLHFQQKALTVYLRKCRTRSNAWERDYYRTNNVPRDSAAAHRAFNVDNKAKRVGQNKKRTFTSLTL